MILQITFAIMAFLVPNPARAAGVESLASGSAAAFERAAASQAQSRPPLRFQRYVPVAGYVSLTGSTYVPSGSSYITVTLTGFAAFQDSSGRITSHPAYISVTQGLWASQPWISSYAYVTAFPSFFHDGTPIGAFPVSGSLHISGWVTGNWVQLTGTGTLTGMVVGKD